MLTIIRKNNERYPGIAGEESPEELCVSGTLEQATWVAGVLSSWYAGCDYIFYEVKNDD